ncbi:helix-turn-helix domain-containing protein [Kineococcus sp. R8]|nr:helix-turn-helix domain-containing protein [Kineococcus siccus]
METLVPRTAATPTYRSPEWLAELLGVPLATLYRWSSRGEGPPTYKIGRHLRYREDEVVKWVASRRAGGAG